MTIIEKINSLTWLRLKEILKDLKNSTTSVESRVETLENQPPPSGDFIPLSGTTEGNSVSGDIEFIGDGEITSIIAKASETYISYLTFNTDENSTTLKSNSPSVGGWVGTNSGAAYLFSIDFFTNETNSITVDDVGVRVVSTKSNPRGIISEQDYSSNITDLDYTQKIYVDSLLPKVADNFVNDAAAAIGGIAVGKLYHTAGAVKLRLS